MGLSLGKGLAYALGLPIVGVDSLAAWLAAEPSAPAAIARAGAAEAWLLERAAEVPIIVKREALDARGLPPGCVAPVELASAFGLAGTTPPHRAAAGVAALAAPRLAASPDDLVTLEPAYLRAPARPRNVRGGDATMSIALRTDVRSMRMSDITAVHEIERSSFNEPWPEHALRQELTGNRLARYLVAERGGRIVGYAGVWLMVDEAHITTFGVLPDARRTGVGARMLLAVADLALELGAARLTLEVRPTNSPARALYARFGFAEVGRRPRYYTDDGEDALVMTTPELRGHSMQPLLALERARLMEPEAPA